MEERSAEEGRGAAAEVKSSRALAADDRCVLAEVLR
jgi:hypothetical protein